MRYNVYVDRDLLMSFDDEVAALAFVREQFDECLTTDEVWLEIGDGDGAQILQGEKLLRRLRPDRRPGRLSV
jgi:hypothetical protein